MMHCAPYLQKTPSSHFVHIIEGTSGPLPWGLEEVAPGGESRLLQAGSTRTQ